MHIYMLSYICLLSDARVAMTNVDLLSHDTSGILTVEKESLNMSRFLNRILGLPVGLQNNIFSYFTDTLHSIIMDAKRLGRYDSGIMDFGATGEHVEMVESREFVGDAAFGTATTQLHKVSWPLAQLWLCEGACDAQILVERGMSFADALTKLNIDNQAEEGFYLQKKVCNLKLFNVKVWLWLYAALCAYL